MTRIPHYIHQTWKTTEIPLEFLRCVDSWKELNPGWQHVLWTDATMEAFVEKNFPEIHPLYLSYPNNIFRADLFRLLVLYEVGGVYADLDMECVKSLDHLFKTHAKESALVLSYQHPTQSKLLWREHPLFHFEFAAAASKNDILHAIIEHIIKKRFYDNERKQNIPVFYVTGPNAITEALRTMPIKELVHCRKLTILGHKIISPLAAIHIPAIPFEMKRASIKMLLRKEFYPETCTVHYYRGTYYAKTKTALTITADELKQLLIAHTNPAHRIVEWLRILKMLVIFEVRRIVKPLNLY